MSPGLLYVGAPKPNCPWSLEPKSFIWLFELTIAVCWSPAETLTISPKYISGFISGFCHFVLPKDFWLYVSFWPFPSWELKFLPQDQKSPFVVTATPKFKPKSTSLNFKEFPSKSVISAFSILSSWIVYP